MSVYRWVETIIYSFSHLGVGNVIDYRCIYECNIFLQADLVTAECKVLSLTEEHDSIITRAEEAESSLSLLKSDLEAVNTAKKTETELLARKVRY